MLDRLLSLGNVAGKGRFFSAALIIYCSLAFSLAFFHFEVLNRDFRPEREVFHEGVVSGQADRPYQYRALAPFVVEAVAWPVTTVLGLKDTNLQQWTREGMYVLVRLFSIFFFLVFFHLFVRNWLSDEMSLAATLLFGSLYFFTMHRYYFQPSSGVNLMLITLFAHWAMQNKGSKWLIPLAMIGSFARETSGMMAALYLCRHGITRKSIIGVIPIVLGWAAVQIGMRLAFGWKPAIGTNREFFDQFQASILSWPIFLFFLLWVIPLLGYRRLPPFFQRAMYLFMPPIIAVSMLFGEIEETRLFLDLGIVLIPSTFLLLFGGEMADASHAVREEPVAEGV